MKIELIKETQPDGRVRYFTEINGKYVDGSLMLTEDKATEVFDFIKSNKGIIKSETIKSETI